jgi:hypothetical protein
MCFLLVLLILSSKSDEKNFAREELAKIMSVFLDLANFRSCSLEFPKAIVGDDR